jgi:hypothetical protein
MIRWWRRRRHDHDCDPLVCLAECDGCAGYLEDMRRLVGSLGEVAEPAPDPETREALLRAFRDLHGPA